MATRTMHSATDPERFDEVVEVLSRHRAIAESERETVLQYLKRAPALDKALLTGAAHIKPQLAAFRADHRRHFENSPREYAFIALILLTLIVVSILLWDGAA